MHEMTIFELQARMQSGELDSQTITEMYLERIEAFDRNGPAVRSVLQLNPDALETAAALDQERRAGHERGPLHGIPILIKDNIDTHDRMTTSAGSLALEGSIPDRDAFVVERLRAAGVVLLGKTNLSEWANFRSTRSSSGWSSLGGQTKNPHVLDRTPCGSSSGSGAAAAAGFCAAAVGTETNGSIICPSQANGIVGIKPTVGLVSRSGIIPISHNQDTAGPMARTVEDAVALLDGMAGFDLRDPATAAGREHAPDDYTRFLDPAGLQGARIGIARNGFSDNPRVTKIIENAIEVMKRTGATIVDPVNLSNEAKFWPAEIEVLLYEFKADLDVYLTGLGDGARVHNLAEVIAFNDHNKARVMPFFDQERMLAAQKKGPLTHKKYLKALEKARRLSREEGIDAALKAHSLDAIVSQAGPLPWLIDLVNGDASFEGGCASGAVAGYPVITVPAGNYCGLPVGISFTGTAWSEPNLIRLAYAYEQAAQTRPVPRFLPTVEANT